MKLDVKSATGSDAGTVDVPDELFGIEPNTAVMHQVVTAQLAAARSGTHSTKTRAEVRGGGAKPWRQKGTGRARQGSDPRAALARRWCGARPEAARLPAAHPQEDDQASRCARPCPTGPPRTRCSSSTSWGISEPRTKDAIELLATLGLRTPGERDARILLVLERDEDAVWKSFRNLGDRVQIVIPDELNTYDVLVNDWLVFTKATLQSVVARFGGTATSDAEGATPSTPAASERDQEDGAE